MLYLNFGQFWANTLHTHQKLHYLYLVTTIHTYQHKRLGYSSFRVIYEEICNHQLIITKLSNANYLFNRKMLTICLTGITFFKTDLVVSYRLFFLLWNVAVQYCSLCLTHHMFLPPSSPRPSGVKSNMDNTKDKLPSPAEKVL